MAKSISTFIDFPFEINEGRWTKRYPGQALSMANPRRGAACGKLRHALLSGVSRQQLQVGISEGWNRIR
jgi:hypothetical protein